MKAPSPTLTPSTTTVAPAASFFDMIDEAISGTMSMVAVTLSECVELLVGRHEVGGLSHDREPRLSHLIDELLGGELDLKTRGSARACPLFRPCDPARGRSSCRTGPAGGDDRADSDRRPCPPRRLSSVCRRHAARAPRRGRASLRSDHRVGERVRLPAGEPRGSRRPCTTRPSGSRGPRPVHTRVRAPRSRRPRAPCRSACARSARPPGSSSPCRDEHGHHLRRAGALGQCCVDLRDMVEHPLRPNRTWRPAFSRLGQLAHVASLLEGSAV